MSHSLTDDIGTLTLAIKPLQTVRDDLLQIMVSENDVQGLEEELRLPRDPNYRGEGQMAALWLAAAAGNIDKWPPPRSNW